MTRMAKPTGGAGGRISPSASGARCARITAPGGNAWEYFPHDHARSRAYRWGEDGIAGFCDDQQRLCLSLALWNGKDPILKERLFGLTNAEGNHGEDVKELYYYLDATPTHSYLKMLYKYPQGEFPYARLVEENRAARRGSAGIRTARHGRVRRRPLLRRVRRIRQGRAGRHPDAGHGAQSRGPEAAASCTLLPQLWFRNTWSWNPDGHTPELSRGSRRRSRSSMRELGKFRLDCDGKPDVAVLRQRDQRSPAVRPGGRHRLFQGCLPRIPRRTANTIAVNPGADRHQGGCALRVEPFRRAVRNGAVAACPGQRPNHAPAFRRFRRDLCAAARARRTSSTPSCSRASPTPTRGSCSARPSPG